jgi:hypothetical protein
MPGEDRAMRDEARELYQAYRARLVQRREAGRLTDSDRELLENVEQALQDLGGEPATQQGR